MAVLDQEQGTVVVRVVYDGPPMSGKTTSLKALSRTLADRRRSEVYSPEEILGRTLYFDWLEYVGGLIAGYQVRCQIISVPGQLALAKRRRFLLSGADIVVFVADTSREGLASSVNAFRESQPLLARPDGPPVGVVIQANKRDLPTAASLEEVRRAFGDLPQIGVHESVASDGLGIRETFVFAVRLALDRARHLMQTDALRVGKPEVESGEELLAQLTKLDAGVPLLSPPSILDLATPRAAASEPAPPREASPAPTGKAAPSEPALAAPAPVASTAPAASSDSAPLLPNSSIPSGLVWPPVTGRVALHQIEREAAQLQRLANGDWSGSAGIGWLLLSRADERFDSIEEGRRALLQIARVNGSLARVLSEGRCCTLAEDGHQGWRLWHFVQRERSARAELIDLVPQLAAHASSSVTERLVHLAEQLLAAAIAFTTPLGSLPLSLDTVGIATLNGHPPRSLSGLTAPTFIDFLPTALAHGEALPAPAAPAANLLGRLLRLQFEDLAERGSVDRGRLAVELARHATTRPASHDTVAQLLAALGLGGGQLR